MMAREYTLVPEFYIHMHDLQPPTPHYHHHHQFDLTQSSTGASPYELTGGGGGGACAEGGALAAAHVPMQLQPLQQHHHDARKKKTSHFSNGFEMATCETPLSALPPASAAPAAPAAATRKRKLSSYAGSAYDDDGTDDARSARTLPDKKQNHSEIEKRRRDKMNTYITELSAMVPMCGAMARKLDKLTVLRMAVQHLRSVRGALSAGPLTARPRPAFLSERELNALVLGAARDCFLLVVGCDRGRLLYVSASVTTTLHYDQTELLGQSLFDILHPKDVAKVKEQLSSSDLSPRERLIDAKTMLPVKADVVAGASRLCPGARRFFFCRIKCRSSPTAHDAHAAVKEEADAAKMRKKHANEKKYCVVQCTGYMKSWAPVEAWATEGGEEEAGNPSCLVAVGRVLPPPPAPPARPPARRMHYVSRHATDGKFLFVDQRVTLALGYLPQELLGTSLYELVGAAQLGAVARTHKAALLQRAPLRTPAYCFRRKDGSFARIQTHFKPFRNPWTKDVECLVANNTVLCDEPAEPADPADDLHYDMYAKQNDGEAEAEMQRLIESHVESHKIGATIAEEALRRSSADFSPELTVDLPASLPPDLLHDAVFTQQNTLVDNILGVELGAYSHVRNNVPLSAAGAQSPPGAPSPPASPPASPPLPPHGFDGNGEAAMAVIMSLLEADAGLGGPVNFSGLPWPLP
ncbi:protein cycle [Epargyreus clarus]|uniref:protein cycle n=1 Tax=Epargyreus clarus TaxID=520877 RepID=UPI003C309687